MVSRVRRALAGLVVVAAASGLTQVASYAADPVVDHPPVAVDDTVTIYAGAYSAVDVLANDSDPDGDALQVCRAGTAPAGLTDSVEAAGMPVTSASDTTDLAVFAPYTVPAGTYSLTYDACDASYLSAATVHVTVRHAARVRVSKTRYRGLLRVVNPSGFRADVMLQGPIHQPVTVGDFAGYYMYAIDVDADITLAPHSSRLVRVYHRTVQWDASAVPAGGSDAYVPLGNGQVTGIVVPRHTSTTTVGPDRVAAPARDQMPYQMPAQEQPRSMAPMDAVTPADDPSTSVPPVANNHTYAVYRGPTILSPLAGDSDPEGGRLDLCHAYTADRGVAIYPWGDELYVDTSHATPGTHTITYSACNADRRTSATITLTVTQAKRLVVKKIAGRPSRLRVTNPNPRRAWIDADDFARTSTAVVHWIKPGATVTIPFHHRYGGWIAGLARGGNAGSATLSNVRLTKRDAAADRSQESDVDALVLAGVLPAS